MNLKLLINNNLYGLFLGAFAGLILYLLISTVLMHVLPLISPNEYKEFCFDANPFDLNRFDLITCHEIEFRMNLICAVITSGVISVLWISLLSKKN